MNLPKYRGLTFQGKWVYGVPVKNPTHNTLTIVKSITEDDINCWIVKPETIGQSTELFDRNGIEIYENDIIEVYSLHDSNAFDMVWNNSLLNISSKVQLSLYLNIFFL